MNSDLLIVASPTSRPLCTDQPVPTDGQPDKFTCCQCRCSSEWTDGMAIALGDEADEFWCQVCGEEQPLPRCDGPFPFTVARYDIHAETPGLETEAAHIGAIVELVEITGPSHHADKGPDRCRRIAYCWRCEDSTDDHDCEPFRYCHEDAAPDCWHTPVGTVTPVGPIPCERPGKRIDIDSRSYEPAPSVWVADAETGGRLKEVTADA